MRVPAFETNLPGQRDAQAQFAAIFRMKVAAIVSAVNPAGGKVLKCNRWDGVNTGVRTYMVEPLEPHAIGDDIYAVIVAGKTASTYTGSTTAVTRHVVFKEYSLLLGVERGCTCTTNSGSRGDASNFASLTYDITPFGGAATIGANLLPINSRARIYKQTIFPGTMGTYMSMGTALVLWDVNETADQENCL